MDYHEKALESVKAKLENRKKDVSEAKQKLSTIKRWKPSPDREQALLATDSLINYVQTGNRDAMFRRSATTKRLSELFPEMAAAQKFSASSREYLSVNAFQDQYNRLEEKDVASLPLRSKVLIIPAKAIYLCVSKFDVTLREAPLRAMRAMHMILTRMVLFRCMLCNERFPTFHPAYQPPAHLEMDVLKRGRDGVPHCSVEVASWRELPPFREEAEDVQPDAASRGSYAKGYQGLCRCCHVDIKKQEAKGLVAKPRRSYLNNMDPWWNFPKMVWDSYYSKATVTEACLVSMDFMQVNFCHASSFLHVFRKNTISFPQDIGSFFARMGAMKQFRVGDRVNSVRGPGEDAGNPERPPRLWTDASANEQKCHMIFPARVKSVGVGGSSLVLVYTADGQDLGEGLETEANVKARIQMPWHPRHLRENLVLLLRRNVGFGKTLEGLEVRWGLVAQIIRFLSSYPEAGRGPWREGGEWQEPMHKYYDPQLFHFMDEEEILAQYAPKKFQGEFIDNERAMFLEEQGEGVERLETCGTRGRVAREWFQGVCGKGGGRRRRCVYNRCY